MTQGATYEPLSAASEFVSATAQDACLEALDHGARRLIVEISDLTSLSLDSMQLLVVIADILAAQGGLLLRACRNGTEGSQCVLPLEEEVRNALDRMIARRQALFPY